LRSFAALNQPLASASEASALRLLVAARLGHVRLIDNIAV
jgi:pantothenate synthetase